MWCWNRSPSIFSLLFVWKHHNYICYSTGSDSNDGLSKAIPFKNLGKINSITFSAGDIIKFKKGDMELKGKIQDFLDDWWEGKVAYYKYKM